MAKDEGSWTEEISSWICCYRRTRKPTIGQPRLTMTSNSQLAMYLTTPSVVSGNTAFRSIVVPTGGSPIAQKTENVIEYHARAESVPEGHPLGRKGTANHPEEKNAQGASPDDSAAVDHAHDSAAAAK